MLFTLYHGQQCPQVMGYCVSSEMPYKHLHDMVQFDFESCSVDLGFSPRARSSLVFPQQVICPSTLSPLLCLIVFSNRWLLAMTRRDPETKTRRIWTKLDHLSAYLSGSMNVSRPSVLIHTQLDLQVEYRKEAVKWHPNACNTRIRSVRRTC
jgi:hypothetical protein